MQGHVINWISIRERLPRVEDADEYGCVLIWDRLNGVKITGWRNDYELSRAPVTHWATPPKGPVSKG